MTTTLPRRPDEPAPDLMDYLVVHRAMTTDVRRLAEVAEGVSPAGHGNPSMREEQPPCARTSSGISAEIRSHHQIEDEHVWPFLVGGPGRHADTDARPRGLTSDHDELDPLLDTAERVAAGIVAAPTDPAQAATGSPTFSPRFRALLDRHIADEEHGVFPVIRRYVGGGRTTARLTATLPRQPLPPRARVRRALGGRRTPRARSGPCSLPTRAWACASCCGSSGGRFAAPAAPGVRMTTLVQPPNGAVRAGGPGARHAAYAALAAAGPVHRVDAPQRHPGVARHRLRRRPRRAHRPPSVKHPGPTPVGGLLPPEVSAAMNSDLLHNDPPDHTRLRRLVSGAFTRRRVDALAPRIQQIADGLLDDLAAALAEHGEADLIAAYAYPLPITVIGELLGVPTRDQAGFRTGRRRSSAAPRSARTRGSAPATALVAYVRELVTAKRAHPARRPDVRAGRGARRGRPAHRGRADVHGVPAARRGPRDHGQPHRQRDAHPPHPPRPARAAAAPSRSASRPRSRSCCASTARCRWRRSAGRARPCGSATP